MTGSLLKLETCFQLKFQRGLSLGKIKQQELKSKNGEVIVLRSANQTDADKLNDLVSEVFQSSEYLVTTLEEFSSSGKEQQTERIKKYEEDEGSILLVAERMSELIGIPHHEFARKEIGKPFSI